MKWISIRVWHKDFNDGGPVWVLQVQGVRSHKLKMATNCVFLTRLGIPKAC